MHRLIEKFPVNTLAPEARSLREDYLAWTAQRLPVPDVVQVGRSDAKYDDSDPFLHLTGLSKVVLKDAPTTEMIVYPYYFVNPPREMQKYPSAPYVTEETEEWFSKIEAFVLALGEPRTK